MVLKESNIPSLKLARRGKVRDVYDVDEGLLIVATDRISAFDVVLPTPIPLKGELLNRISLFWFDMMKDIVPNHVITADVASYPVALRPYADMLRGRSVLVRKASPLPVECIVRGYIAGSGWKEYNKQGTVCGIPLPLGMSQCQKLGDPLFTPSTKADVGEHDENISFERAADIIGSELAGKVRDLSIEIYAKARDYAETRGIIIADTKFEFGICDGELILIDEVLTPDSSRFWPRDTYASGRDQESLDKQYIRNYLLSIDWEKLDVIPELPPDVVDNTYRKYRQAYEVLTGSEFVEA